MNDRGLGRNIPGENSNADASVSVCFVTIERLHAGQADATNVGYGSLTAHRSDHE
jgi:hypothetical protein